MPTGVSQAALRAFTLAREGRLADAQAAALSALRAHPRDHALMYVLGCTLRDQGHAAQAVYHLQRAAKANPDDAEYAYALATACDAAGQTTDALAALRRTLELNPSRTLARVRLADLLLETARPEQAAALAIETARLNPDIPQLAATAAAAGNYSSALSPADRFELHRAAARAHQPLTDALPPLPPLPPETLTPEAGRPLRVAYLSPDLCTHSVTQFLEPLWAARDRKTHHTLGLFLFPRPDATTERLKSLADAWRDLPQPTFDAVAAAVRELRADVVIDLAGLSTATGVWALARRLAPVQATWLGYPNTTGLPTVDARIVDSTSDPSPRADALAVERLVRLDPCFLCFNLPPLPSPPSPLPSPSSPSPRPITFGSFNILAKVSAATRRAWRAVLDAVPGSRLLLKDKGLEHPQKRAEVLAALAPDLDPSRLTLMGRTPTRAEHLALYARVDLCLDTFPYNGTTTTCEALAMGVPVLTIAGDDHVSRVGASILRCAGLSELIAEDIPALATLARDLASDPARLAALRARVRPAIETSPLCDAPAFAARFEAALRALHRAARA